MSKPSKFAAWQEAKQQKREALIDEYLKFLSKSRIKVRYVTDLADMTAQHISQIEGEPCNKSTLMRNVRYKRKLLSFVAHHVADEVRVRAQGKLVALGAEAILTTKTLEVGNLKRHIERQSIYITSLEERLSRVRESSPLWHQGTEDGAQSQQMLSDHEYNFVRTCQALYAVLKDLETILEIDEVEKRILRRGARRDRAVVVDKEIAAPFVDWLKTVAPRLKPR